MEIQKCIDSYYLGKINSAYQHLEKGLNHGISFSSSKLFEESFKLFPAESLNLYRIRQREKQENIEFNREQMFHIPFQKRGIVSTQRYSIPGHPSLYLGDSIFVCWQETNQPAIKEVYASRFVNTCDLKIIEIKRTEDLLKEIESLEGLKLSSEIFRFLLLFPLIVGSSIKVKNRKDTFKPQYILPQLFFQFITENKSYIDGIKYFSTRIDYSRIQNVNAYNYVFPTTTNTNNGYCTSLIRKFKLTLPVLWEYEEMNTSNMTFIGNNPRNDITIELYQGRKVPYDWTTFKAIENALRYPSLKLGHIEQ